jgi:hypothetical protein
VVFAAAAMAETLIDAELGVMTHDASHVAPGHVPSEHASRRQTEAALAIPGRDASATLAESDEGQLIARHAGTCGPRGLDDTHSVRGANCRRHRPTSCIAAAFARGLAARVALAAGDVCYIVTRPVSPRHGRVETVRTGRRHA